MATTSNSTIQLADLDFDNIKSNFINYLKGLPGNPFQDYNFQGSSLNALLDILAYNTHYNAFYLNMVANEMFLDTATQRKSVVSHAKLLGYTPQSAIAPTASINIQVTGVSESTLTLPRYTRLVSSSIDGVNYPFITITDTTVPVSNNIALFQNVTIKQGDRISYVYPVDLTQNPSGIFEIPEANIDSSTLMVSVFDTPTSSNFQNYTLATNLLALTSNSQVYFLQESLKGTYEIYFGDGVLGKAITTGQQIVTSYLVTQGATAAGANNFVLVDPIQEYSNGLVLPQVAATVGANKESIDSIKFRAPKAFTSQNRAITKQDYLTAINGNSLGYKFDAVNVWGGQENNPPVYGKVFISLKPSGGLTLTATQKTFIVTNILQPISILTAQPQIIDPDYTYLNLTINVLYDPTKTSLTANQIQTAVLNSINNYANTSLNSFNSTFSLSQLIIAIQGADSSIITNEATVKIQKKFYPLFGGSSNYTLNFNAPLQKGILTSGISTFPALMFNDPNNPGQTVNNVYLEEIPSPTGGLQSVSILNPGFGYTQTPTLTVVGDGTGANAIATIINGSINSVTVTSQGSGYTQASIIITNDPNDKSGSSAVCLPVIANSAGSLQAYYYNNAALKSILYTGAGTIDYVNGIVTLIGFNPVGLNNPTGQLTVTATPKSTIIASKFNQIVTIDPFDPAAITINVTAKTS